MSDKIDDSNFRETARRAIEAYDKKGLVYDAILWSTIIAFYNDALDKAQASATVEEPKKP